MRILLAASVCAAMSLWADCPEGSYTTTESDKKFYIDTVAVVKGAIPPAPEGWRLEDKNRTPYVPPSSLCKGSEKEPLITGYWVKYTWVEGQKQRALKLSEVDQKLAAVGRTPVTPDQQKAMTELGTKDRDLRWQAKKLAPTDKAASDKMYAEALVYAKQLAEIRNAHYASLKPQMDALNRERDEIFKSIPTEIELNILVNGSGVDLRETNASPAQAGSGITQAGPDRTVLAYGNGWKRESSGLRSSYTRGGSVQKVYGISVEGKGDPNQVKTLLAGLDGTALKSLVAK